MNTDDLAACIGALMREFDKNRAAWITKFGTDVGFDAWFTQQVNMGVAEAHQKKEVA